MSPLVTVDVRGGQHPLILIANKTCNELPIEPTMIKLPCVRTTPAEGLTCNAHPTPLVPRGVRSLFSTLGQAGTGRRSHSQTL